MAASTLSLHSVGVQKHTQGSRRGSRKLYLLSWFTPSEKDVCLYWDVKANSVSEAKGHVCATYYC